MKKKTRSQKCIDIEICISAPPFPKTKVKNTHQQLLHFSLLEKNRKTVPQSVKILKSVPNNYLWLHVFYQIRKVEQLKRNNKNLNLCEYLVPSLT